MKAPNKLFICLLKSEGGWDESLTNAGKEHSCYMTELWKRGIFWAGGPTAENISIEIYSVDTVEEAMKAQRAGPLYLKGYLHDDKYLEWNPVHWPPQHPGIDPDSGKRIRH